MANINNINFNKNPLSSELFDQDKYYEDNFEKINTELIPSFNAQLAEKVQNFKLKNEVVNGDFSQGATGWVPLGTPLSISVTDKILSFTASVPSGLMSNLIDVQAGNKIYLKSKAKPEIKDKSISLILFGVDSNPVIAVNLDPVYKRLSGIHTVVNTGKARAYLRNSGGGFVYIDGNDGIVFINLTGVFGIGNEPTKLEMDELIKVIPNQWWDGELTLTQKQFITWQLNLIRKNTNAIIALGGTIV